MTFSTRTAGPRTLPSLRQIVLSIAILGLAAGASLVATQQPLLAVAAVVALPLLLALLIWSETATLIAVFLIYSNAAVIAVKFHGVPFVVGAAVPLLFLIPLAYDLIFRRQKLVFGPVMPLLFLFLAVQILGTLFSDDIQTASSTLIEFVLEGIILYFLVVNAVRTPETLRRVIWALLLAGILLGGVPTYQQMTGTFDNKYGGFGQTSETGFSTGEESLQGAVKQFRLAGAIGEQNRYAQVMLMLVPLGLFRFWGERSKLLRVLALVATAFSTMGMALTFSRGAAVAFALMLVIMGFMRIIKVRQFVFLILIAVLVLVALPQYRTRLVTIQSLTGWISSESQTEESEPDGAIQGRTTSMLAAVLIFADHPLVGVGPGMTQFYTQEYGNQLDIKIQYENRQAHNLYLDIAAAHGLPGILLLLAILYVTIRDLYRSRNYWLHRRPEYAFLASGFMFVIISYMTTGIFLHFSYVRFFWIMLGLASAASYITAIPKADRQPALSSALEQPYKEQRLPL